MDDLISRDLIKSLGGECIAARDSKTHELLPIFSIDALPSAQPEQRWISSGKKPLEEGSYLVWMPFAPPKHRMAVAEYCCGYWNIKTPISAWMPLPEPYAERRTDG